MYRLIRNIAIAALFISALWASSCNKENDFYEVGRQPVSLTRPQADTVIILDYEHPDSLFTFAWSSRRHFINYKLHFGLDEAFTTSCEQDPGVSESWKLTTMQLDSVLSSMKVGIGETVRLYWTVTVVDPTVGWCDEVRQLTITRCDLPTGLILLTSPENEAEILLDKKTPEAEVAFSWECASTVPDYKLLLSLDPLFPEEGTLSTECGSETSHAFTTQEMDAWLAAGGVEKNTAATVYWKVTGTGDLNNPIEKSSVREVSIRRVTKDPVALTLVAPEADGEVLLDADLAEESVCFEWSCDTTGVDYTLRLYDAEFEKEATFETGEECRFEISQSDLDLLLEQTFGMVASQKKKFVWNVVPSDPERATAEEEGQTVFIRRFEAVTAADPITLTGGPADGAEYQLNYGSRDEVLATAAWECNARNVTYALEYSLDAEMNAPKMHPLTTGKSVEMTHALLDELLSDLGGAYLTRTIYWRITSTVNIKTTPSEIRSLRLTGMLRPYTDLRDPENPEVYEVVKIGEDFWMAENLRAMKYSDGTAFTTVDEIYGNPAAKSYTDALIDDPKIRGVYYSWPTALRTYDEATDAEDTRMQGVCPDGWHVSTMQEWRALQTAAGSDATRIKSAQYWTGNTGTNELGLNIVPAGKFWHGNVGTPDNAVDKASFWTTTKADATTAQMFEVFGWSNEILPWQFNSRPWSEGDGTASMLVNVRCVRDRD